MGGLFGGRQLCALFFFPLSRVFSSLYDGPRTQPVLFPFPTPPASDVRPENTDLTSHPVTHTRG